MWNTFDQVKSNDTYGMHDPTNAPVELPPYPLVVWDLGSFLSEEHVKEINELRR